MRVAIIQPNYIPWKGYFDIIHDVDVFVFLDDVQYTVRDWRNRNKIKTRDGQTTWLTVPTLGGRNQPILSVEIDEAQPWRRKHLDALRHAYGRTPHFERYFAGLSATLAEPWKLLVDLDIALTKQICGWLGCERRCERSSTLAPSGAKDDRLIDLVQKVGGSFYLSGPAARDYIRPERRFGRSTNNWIKNIWWARKGIFSFSFMPLDLLFYGGIGMTLLSLAALLFQVLYRLWHPSMPRGIATIVVLILFFGGVQLMGLSVLGEYLGKVLEETKRRPKFIRRSIRAGKRSYATEDDMQRFVASRARPSA